ncbi:hypothetical protein [Leptolyngbya sp. FACHB-17]|uniref:hypothetical protein n=1 Tax=unclassified Leptolyngbya TaxID=2650499 RepID=UPI001680AADA|nr:hypothetical protein [Leptolyngbya sp. FACHB-17]
MPSRPMPEPQTWEFLIQLDGDRAWLPLDTSEILEGRYRIAAKSSYKNAPVEVRIQYDAIDEVPPKRRTQTRTYQTNPNGLMAVIPFTHLQSGIWEFHCSPQEGSPQSLRFRVLSLESDAVDDWSPVWDIEEFEAIGVEPVEAKAIEVDRPLVEEALKAEPERVSVEEILQQAEQESTTIADEILTEYGLIAETPYPDYRLPETVVAAAPLVAIDLAQNTYIARWGDSLSITGQITSAQTAHLDAELRICLRDPQTSERLLETCRTLDQAALPFELSYQVMLPAGLETQLVLGEITLHDPKVEGHPIVATEFFTLLAELDQLLEAMYQAKEDDRAMAEDMLDLPAPKSAVQPPLNLAFLDFVAAPKDAEAVNFTPKETQALPPQLHPPSPYRRKSLNLPNFGIQPDGAIPEYAPPEATQLEIPLSEVSVSEVSDEISVSEVSELTEPPIEAPEDPTEEALLDLLTPVEEPEASELKVQADDREITPLEESGFQASSESSSIEVVVDDEPILPFAELIVSRRQNKGQSDRAQNPLLLPEHESVPDPIVTIAEAELTGGKTTTVRIRLPDIAPKIYVKLWVSDRQSRSMIEPSRWIIDFKPDGHGNLEATTEVKVPFESVEIQIEAIAVEVMTNRESHKVTVDRRVTPEELPDLWIDPLDDSIVSS